MRVESAPRRPLLGALLVMTGLVLAGLAAVVTIHTLFLGIWPFLVGLSLLYTRHKRWAAIVGPEALEVEAGDSISYDQIHAVLEARSWWRPMLPHYPLIVVSDRAPLWIPAKLNVPSLQLLQLLRSRIPEATRILDARLSDFVTEQQTRHGPTKVHAYLGREWIVTSRWPGRRPLGIALACLLTAILWLTCGGRYSDGWPVLGMVLLVSTITAGIFLAVYHLRRPYRRNPLQTACLVVAPEGVAVAQGPLVGRLRWAQVQRVSNRSGLIESPFLKLHCAAIQLRVAGAVAVNILDIYNAPFEVIQADLQAHLVGTVR